MMSSLMPSLKYSCSASPLMLANGRTQIETRGVAAAAGAEHGADLPALRGARARDHGAERAQHFLERRAPGVFAPVVEVGRMQGAHVHGQAGLFESHRNQDAPIGGLARLAAHPAGGHRSRGPDDQHGTWPRSFPPRSGRRIAGRQRSPDPTRPTSLSPRSRPRSARRAPCRCGHRKRKRQPCLLDPGPEWIAATCRRRR